MPEEPRKPFLVEHLEQLAARGDRGALAALRRGLGKPPGTAVEVFPHVTPFIPADDNVPGRDWPYYLVASLFSIHPDPGARGDMGWTMRQIATNESIEARFLALLTCHVDDLSALLRQAVSLAASAKRRTPVDWTLLLLHLRHWSHPDRWVQRQWARSFWGAEHQTDPETT